VIRQSTQDLGVASKYLLIIKPSRLFHVKYNMYQVYQHWDPLRVCVVGRSYPPEFYSWIKVPHVRKLFERIAIETEEDFQNIIKKLKEFGVEVLRPNINFDLLTEPFPPPPMTPRDTMCMIGDTFYRTNGFDFQRFYNDVKDESWPECKNLEQFYKLSDTIKKECLEIHDMNSHISHVPYEYKNIIDHIRNQGNKIRDNLGIWASGAMVSRIGKDLYFATPDYDGSWLSYQGFLDKEFKNTRNHIIITGGHGDGTYCPVCPGLIISLNDVPTYAKTFPGWEVVYLPNQSWSQVRPFLDLKEKNLGRWWIPGFEYDQSVIDVVETWLGHWTGYVEETVFDVNMLIIDHKNVIVFNYNKQVFDALARYGITAHIVPFRHRYFWDGGIHCVTLDLDREGVLQNWFN